MSIFIQGTAISFVHIRICASVPDFTVKQFALLFFLCVYSNSHDDGLLTNRLYDMDESTLAEPERDMVQPVQTTTTPSLNYDTAIDDQQAENERNIYSSIDEQQNQTTPTVTHRNQSQVNDERYSEVAFNTSKGEDSGAADVYASIDT